MQGNVLTPLGMECIL